MLLIAGGLPRSGTTTFMQICNRHPEIFLASEIPIYDVQCHLLDCLRGVQTGMAKRGMLDGFREREVDFVKDMFFAANDHRGKLKAARRRFRNARVHGHKTPSCELTFAEYEELLGHHEPRYAYCLRDPVDCLNSRLRMPWKEMSFDELMDKMRDSYRAFLEARDRHPDRIFLFRIEEYAAGPQAVARRLCEFLDVDSEAVEAMCDLDATNSSAKLRKNTTLRDRQLTDEEVERVRSDPLVRQVSEQFVWTG